MCVRACFCVCQCPWPCTHVYFCFIFNSLITLHAKHVPCTEITLQMSSPKALHRGNYISRFHFSSPAFAFQQPPVYSSFWVCGFNYQIKQDVQIMPLLISSHQVLLWWRHSGFSSLLPLSLWEPLCSVNLWNLSSLYQETAGTQFILYVSTG